MGRITEHIDYCFLACYEQQGDKIREECPIYHNCYSRQMHEKLSHYEDLEEQDRLICLPCKVGDELYKITYPYRQLPKITKYRVKNFKTIKKGQKLQLEVQADSSPCKSWANFENFYTTKEEAEAKLQELKEGVE